MLRRSLFQGDNVPPTIQVMIVDDHQLLREGLSRIIEKEPGLSVSGEAADECAALRILSRDVPDVLVLDLSLHEDSLSFEFLHAVRSRYPRMQVLVYSAHDEFVYGERCLRAGAMGFVSKQAGPRQLLEAIRAAAAGERFVSPALSDRLMKRFFDGDSLNPIDRLSDRELEVFYLMGRGLPAKEIADRLGITRNTVESHFQHVRGKLGHADNTQLIREARKWFIEQAGVGENNA